MDMPEIFRVTNNVIKEKLPAMLTVPGLYKMSNVCIQKFSLTAKGELQIFCT